MVGEVENKVLTTNGVSVVAGLGRDLNTLVDVLKHAIGGVRTVVLVSHEEYAAEG